MNNANTWRPGVWGRLKKRWGVTDWGIVAILLAFSLAGITVLKVGRPIMRVLVPDDAPRWLWWTIKVLVVVPVYETLLLSYGTILGQRRFFWDKQKRLLRLLARPLSRRSA